MASTTETLDPVITSTEYNFRAKDALLGGQMIFVAFGALVLVPILAGLDPSVALFTAGIGTLIFQVLTRGKVPVFLASSFAFIAPIIGGVATWGLSATLSGLAAAGLFYVLLSFLIRTFGSQFMLRLLPPIVTGPIIMIIGLSLAPVGVGMAMNGADGAYSWTSVLIAAIALITTIVVSLWGKGTLRLIPILLGIVVGYIVSLLFGIVNFQPVTDAAWFAMPSFTFPTWSWPAIIAILPVAIAPAIEHFGDVLAISSVTGKDYVEDPGVDRTMLGDGIATTVAALLGGPPNTTYSEVTGAVTITKAFNPAIMTWAAIFAIVLSFVGKLGAFLQTIPAPVMGGILVLLFGSIMSVGMNSMIKAKTDLFNTRNLIIVAIILVFGIGGMKLQFGENFVLEGIALAGIAGVLLNLILPEHLGQEDGNENL